MTKEKDGAGRTKYAVVQNHPDAATSTADARFSKTETPSEAKEDTTAADMGDLKPSKAALAEAEKLGVDIRDVAQYVGKTTIGKNDVTKFHDEAVKDDDSDEETDEE